jgi:hypothetical protein
MGTRFMNAVLLFTECEYKYLLGLKSLLEHTDVIHSRKVRNCAKCHDTDSENLWLLFCVVFSQSTAKTLAGRGLLTNNLNEHGGLKFSPDVLVSLIPDTSIDYCSTSLGERKLST